MSVSKESVFREIDAVLESRNYVLPSDLDSYRIDVYLVRLYTKLYADTKQMLAEYDDRAHEWKYSLPTCEYSTPIYERVAGTKKKIKEPKRKSGRKKE